MQVEAPIALAQAQAQAQAEKFFWAMSNQSPISLPLREEDGAALAQAHAFRFGPQESLAGWRFGAGAGPVVALVHGWGGQGTQFLRMARGIAARGFEAVVIDAGNHGASAPARMGFDRFMHDARALADHLGAMPFAWVAHSAAALGHKSDAGGVALNLADAQGVRSAWSAMHDSVTAYDAGIVLNGVLVERMGARGVEMIVGAKRDPEWGGVVLAGFGGVTAEILKDVVLVTPGMDRAAVIAALGRLKQAPLFHGWRGALPLDLDALADLVLTVGRIIEGNRNIREIDLNPVIVYPKGEGVVALDALMLLDAA